MMSVLIQDRCTVGAADAASLRASKEQALAQRAEVPGEVTGRYCSSRETAASHDWRAAFARISTT